VGGGLNLVSPSNAFDNYVPITVTPHFNPGWAISLAGGYKWPQSIRTELEFSYHQNTLTYFNTVTLPLTGHQSNVSIMGNAFYDVNTNTRLTPYIGVGLGTTMEWWKGIAQPGRLEIRDSHTTKFALQGIVGTAYAFGPDMEATLDFRYRGSNGHTFQLAGGYTIAGYNLREMTVLVGFRYAFERQAPPGNMH
jgi:OOP family OmpA-OmpF porin